mmetsp:Transcript_2445/g.6090  ORF Transcript_2445/g.6090 Transcript_2445/m.6090 type:complete len:101 (+) Transcript_2445:153-455(+)
MSISARYSEKIKSVHMIGRRIRVRQEYYLLASAPRVFNLVIAAADLFKKPPFLPSSIAELKKHKPTQQMFVVMGPTTFHPLKPVPVAKSENMKAALPRSR